MASLENATSFTNSLITTIYYNWTRSDGITIKRGTSTNYILNVSDTTTFPLEVQCIAWNEDGAIVSPPITIQPRCVLLEAIIYE